MAGITNIEQFKSALVSGGVRPTLFYITMGFPGATPGGLGLGTGDVGGPTLDSLLSYTAKAASIPEEIISPIDVGYFGRKIKLSGDRTYRDWNISVIHTIENDGAGPDVRQRFEGWFIDLNKQEANVRSRDYLIPNNYKVDLMVNQLDQSGRVTSGYHLVGAFPVRIGDIRLSWDNQNTIEEYDVTFSYDYFYRESLSAFK